MTHFGDKYVCTQLRWGTNQYSETYSALERRTQPLREEQLKIFVLFLFFHTRPLRTQLGPPTPYFPSFDLLYLSLYSAHRIMLSTLSRSVFLLFSHQLSKSPFLSPSHVLPSIFLPFHCQHPFLRRNTYKIFAES